MRISTVVIAAAVLGAGGYGAYKLGHATQEPANQLFTVAGMPHQAAVASAESNLAGAVSAANTYKLDHTGYTGMTAAGLRQTYDAALAVGVTVRSATATAFCIESVVSDAVVSIRGPNGAFTTGRC